MYKLPTILMGILSLICVLIVLAGLYAALRRTSWTRIKQNRILSIASLIAACWLVFVAVLVENGFFNQFDTIPPRPVLVIMAPFPFVLILAFSSGFKKLALVTPPQWLVYFQSFRIFVEMLLWQAFVQGLLPVQMSFEGRNFDIIAGILALPAGYILMKKTSWSKTAGVIYNIIGLGLLLNIMIISVLSMPTSFRYFTEGPSIEIVGTFPMAYLPTVLVVLAYSFHILSLRQLWLLKKAAASSASIQERRNTKEAYA